MAGDPRANIVLLVLIIVTVVLMIGTVVAASLAGLLFLLGDSGAAFVIEWIVVTLGTLLTVSLVMLLLATSVIQYSEKSGENKEKDSDM